MSSIGDCFVILNSDSEDSVIFGRNALHSDRNEGVAQEVHYYNANASTNEEDVKKFRIILQTPRTGVWGGDCGSNESISIGVSWATPISDECKDNQYSVTDFVRLTLAKTVSADQAVEQIGLLVEKHSHNELKFSLLVCDSSSAWIVNCCGKLWAARCLSDGFYRLPNNGLAIRTDIDKSCKNLCEGLKEQNSFNGQGNPDFAACCNAIGTLEEKWCGTEPYLDGSFTLTNMFNTLRSAAINKSTGSSTVVVWKKNGISSHWFTATPNTNESVFKPFIFSPNPVISPLTKVLNGKEVTLLHKLHAQRKPSAIRHLRALEASCVEEVNRYLQENPSNTELDELMKDCVEAEVKFYR